MLRKPSSVYHFRNNCDNFLIETTLEPTYVKYKSAFSYSSATVWNSLPLSVREADSIAQFKSQLKSYYFELAFSDVPDIWLFVYVFVFSEYLYFTPHCVKLFALLDSLVEFLSSVDFCL